MVLMQHKKWRWKLLSAWIVIFTIAVIWNNHHIRNLASSNRNLAKQNHRLILENKQRIADIQISRTKSCRQTYNVIQNILKQSAQGVVLEDGRKIRYERLIKLADPNRCTKQTKPHHPKTSSSQ